MTARVASRINDIDAAAWDACANPEPARFDPFLTHAFLAALEDAGTVGPPHTGWRPQHIVLEDADGVAACLPCYLKTHSQGEYVFDHAFADAYQRAGGLYYPKLQCAVPFTPVPGRRLLVRPGPGEDDRRRLVAAAASLHARRLGVSSVHITFLTEAESMVLAPSGFLQRTGQQYHWINQGYATFDDFLSTLASRKRKAIRKERAQACSGGVTIEQVTGAAITPAHWDAMFAFYLDTGSRKWGRPYLNRAFFAALGAALADRCLLVMARRGDRYVAGALNLVGGEALYGRYWGALEPSAFLHFEVCYYQAIDYAITHRLARVEAGAQGEHKLARGYTPQPTYSAHWFADPAFARAVGRYLDEERRVIARETELLAASGPYRRAGS